MLHSNSHSKTKQRPCWHNKGQRRKIAQTWKKLARKLVNHNRRNERKRALAFIYLEVFIDELKETLVTGA